MLRTPLLAAATVAALALGLTAGAPVAEAKHRHHHGANVDLFFGFPGYYYDQGYYNGYYADDWGYDYPRYRHHRSSYHCHWVKKKHHRKVKRCHSVWHHRW